MKNVLSIAGTDPTGGAGIQTDLKTFEAHGVYGMAVISAVVAQNTFHVTGMQAVPADLVGGHRSTAFLRTSARMLSRSACCTIRRSYIRPQSVCVRITRKISYSIRS